MTKSYLEKTTFRTCKHIYVIKLSELLKVMNVFEESIFKGRKKPHLNFEIKTVVIALRLSCIYSLMFVSPLFANSICTMDINRHGHSSNCSCPVKQVYDQIVGRCAVLTTSQLEEKFKLLLINTHSLINQIDRTIRIDNNLSKLDILLANLRRIERATNDSFLSQKDKELARRNLRQYILTIEFDFESCLDKAALQCNAVLNQIRDTISHIESGLNSLEDHAGDYRNE